MAADVSSLVRLMTGGDANEAAESTAPITRDLLGGCCAVDSQELDLDLQVPCGWEKRLDLKSGKVYIQRRDISTSDKNNPPQCGETTPGVNLQDLNFPPATSRPTLNLFNDSSLDLQLSSLSSGASSTPSNFESVCTLDKVKSALERAEKASAKKRSRSTSKSSSPTLNSCSSTKDDRRNLDCEDKSSIPIAAGCPRCLMYVLISKSNPKCPRCNGDVPLPVSGGASGTGKKPRIDLNMSI
ncbi:uncharacterized protein LOC127249469 [Andrographis paniculata]|uniref:uncharacterized protein LOC127249469 n=1 Tax=Andrographis paniculata TaxID=175694 RepID=UPI0021E9AEE6|nr:uncharacterized protein LOC127249469 [Andrographis paniculata]